MWAELYTDGDDDNDYDDDAQRTIYYCCLVFIPNEPKMSQTDRQTDLQRNKQIKREKAEREQTDRQTDRHSIPVDYGIVIYLQNGTCTVEVVHEMCPLVKRNPSGYSILIDELAVVTATSSRSTSSRHSVYVQMLQYNM